MVRMAIEDNVMLTYVGEIAIQEKGMMVTPRSMSSNIKGH
jgi:hypothetical protein